MIIGSALVLFPIAWVTIGLLWTPLLLSERIREILDYYPTTSLGINYILSVFLITSIHVLLFLVGGITFPPGDIGLLQYAVALNIGFPTLVWILVVGFAPYYSVQPESIRQATVPLMLGVVWYVIIMMGVLVALVFVVIILAAPFG